MVGNTYEENVCSSLRIFSIVNAELQLKERIKAQTDVFVLNVLFTCKVWPAFEVLLLALISMFFNYFYHFNICMHSLYSVGEHAMASSEKWMRTLAVANNLERKLWGISIIQTRK